MTRGTEDRISTFARRQYGMITRSQLLEAGVGSSAIGRRARTGRLRRIHRGVYLVGPILPPWGLEMAAVLACGPRACLSHVSAARLWGLAPDDDAGPIHVRVPGGHGGDRTGIRVHSTEALAPDERRLINRIPVTAPGRTLLDMATVVSRTELEGAVARAERKGLIDRNGLSALVEGSKGRQGTPALRGIVEAGAAFTRSEAERRFLELVRKARLPPPESNVMVHGYEVDFFWRKERIVVEVDGYRYHSSRPTFESDRRRTAHLAAHGLQVIRLTWRQIAEEGAATAVQIGRALLHSERARARVPGRSARGRRS
jgi:very-short-patch-repair endonuclease